MHSYRVFEIGPDRKEYDTGKVLVCEAPVLEYGLVSTRSNKPFVAKLLELYGFKSDYDYMFTPKGISDSIEIVYNQESNIPYWILKRSI